MTPLEALGFPLEGDRFRLEPDQHRDRQGAAVMVAIIRLRDQAIVGGIALSHDSPTGTLTIERLCVDEPQRGYGAGSEAAALLLAAAESSFEHVRAWAPPRLGLAVYFWVRMGLRPLHGEGPEGGIWFERRR